MPSRLTRKRPRGRDRAILLPPRARRFLALAMQLVPILDEAGAIEETIDPNHIHDWEDIGNRLWEIFADLWSAACNEIARGERTAHLRVSHDPPAPAERT